MKNDRLLKEQIAEKSIQEHTIAGDLRKLPDSSAHQIAQFFETKSLQRLQSAHLIYNISNKETAKEQAGVPVSYSDYSESVSASYTRGHK